LNVFIASNYDERHVPFSRDFLSAYVPVKQDGELALNQTLIFLN